MTFPPARRKNKYGARRTVVDGITFASAKEANRYCTLKTLEKAGEITRLELQPEFPFVIGGTPVRYGSGRVAKYIGDFRYFTRDGLCVVEDVKSKATANNDCYKLKKALVECIYGVSIKEFV